MPIVMIKKPAEPLDPEKIYQANKRFEWLVTFMICRFKFVHTMLGMMTKIPNNHAETMGVMVTPDGKFQLHYNPIWTLELSDAELTYVFQHEVLHLALHHCTRRALSTDPKERNLCNVAHDLAVNELIVENDACQKPRHKKDDDENVPPLYKKGDLSGCFVSELKKEKEYADIEPRQTAEWYYDYLKSKQKKQGGDGEGEGQPGSGSFDDHGKWGEHELADEKISLKISDIDQQNLWGDLSAGEKELILAAQVRKINWRSFIRNWVGNIVWRDRIPTRKKPNRRTGMIHPGFKKSYTELGLVTGDTSGSVGADLLAQYVGVLNQLIETVPFDFAQVDAGVTEKPHRYDRRRDKVEFKGRGGTDFQPIIDMIDNGGYRWAIIMTDGECSAPTKPKRAQVLWVLPPNHNPPCEWGGRVHLQRHV
jgi:predicted metal-dependent peptidase